MLQSEPRAPPHSNRKATKPGHPQPPLHGNRKATKPGHPQPPQQSAYEPYGYAPQPAGYVPPPAGYQPQHVRQPGYRYAPPQGQPAAPQQRAPYHPQSQPAAYTGVSQHVPPQRPSAAPAPPRPRAQHAYEAYAGEERWMEKMSEQHPAVSSSWIFDVGDWIKQLPSKIVRATNDFFEDMAQNPDWYAPRLLAVTVMIFIMTLIWKHFDALKQAARGIKKRIQDFFAPPPLLPVFEQDCDPKINRVFPSTV